MVEGPSPIILPDGTPYVSPPPGFGWDEDVLQPEIEPISTALPICRFDTSSEEGTSHLMEKPGNPSLLVTVKGLLEEIVSQQRQQGELLRKLQMQMDGHQRQRKSSAWSSKYPRSCQGQWREFHGQSKPTTVYYSPSSFKKQEEPTPEVGKSPQPATPRDVQPATPQAILIAQLGDEDNTRVVEMKSTSQKPSPHQMDKEPGAVKRLLRSWDSLEMRGGTLCYRLDRVEPEYLEYLTGLKAILILICNFLWHCVFNCFNSGFRLIVLLCVGLG
ncbi:uncharacterized protein LOC119734704 [Patiria miniata]|uniref:Uncharacterized protein n=1 Tax=Patiria miniata TaxID=46514 RepID=A0A914AKB2_PATMI|nr:uncharacterized protein LOC119734704 [Patiria miniata]